MEVLKGIFFLFLALSCFSLFTLKAPKGKLAMSGLANAAIATFLVEAIFKYIFGDIFNLHLFKEIGIISGSMGGVAATVLVMLALGTNPIFAIATGITMLNFGILEGFIVGYLLSFLSFKLENIFPEGIDVLIVTFILVPLGYFLAIFISPFINLILRNLGDIIIHASSTSPLVMGFLLGGIIKVICTSPLSSMALTAMLGLTGLPMGIACLACFGGAFANGITFYKLSLGARNKVVPLMIEPLTQADIITANPFPMFMSSFLGGALAGIPAAYFSIISNAPGTASPVPGFITPFAFNSPTTVVICLFFSMLGGCLGGLIISNLFKHNLFKNLKIHSKQKIEYDSL